MPLPFGKSKSEKSVDIDAAVRKLKSLYRLYGEKYGTKLFNLKGFEDRYRDALLKRVNLNAFLHAEITAFEELKRRVEKKDEKPAGKNYSEIADRIIEKNLERVRKYRTIDFLPDAEEEIKYLLGAVTDFYYEIWGRVSSIIKPLGYSDIIYKLENDFSYYVVPIRGSYSRAVEDYQLVLSRKNPKESEKASVNFIKYGGILLNNCLKVINDSLNAPGNLREHPESLKDLNRYKEVLLRMIDDFRLSDIREY
ncbi:MAG: hypothetical protein AMS17_09830 [Spirochaetes bacterium DG_61]|jgi:hypothetical protein|nr:MAG: hypothetical protein AMS17_09830 [Spirochaetes bacterium DG_61]